MIQHRAAVARHVPPFVLHLHERAAEAVPAGAVALRTLTMRCGETFNGPRGLEVATVESGALSLEVTTAAGLEFRLGRIGPGDIVVPLDLIVNPAFALSYRAEEQTRVQWSRGRSMVNSGVIETERLILGATNELLGACIRIIHELACLPASHRLYCELLRLAGRDGSPTFAIPTHAVLAARLCTTRETISRELSFLRRSGVTAGGKETRILKPDFLLSRVAAALNLADPNEIWEAIGAARR